MATWSSDQDESRLTDKSRKSERGLSLLAAAGAGELWWGQRRFALRGQGAVEQFGWLTASQMLDGLALGESTPGPLIMVVAFVGFMGGWNRGIVNGLADGISDAGGSLSLAVAATLVTVWFTFLPSFGFILAGAPLVEASRDDLRFGAPFTAITAAVVGVIGSLAAFFSGPVLWPLGAFSPTAALVVALGLLAQLKWRWSVLQVIGAAAACGACWAGLAQLVS